MSERIYNFKAICCEKIPELFLDKLVARKHFSQYGHVTRFILRPRRLSCTVAFETEAQAERALMEGSVYNGHKFDIQYAEHETTNVQVSEDWLNSEVQSELDAISNVWGSSAQLTSFPTKFVNSVLKPAKSTSPTFAQVGTNATSSGANKVNNASEQQPQQQQRNVNPALRQELMALMRRPAYTAEEKYRVLNARDKLVRIMNARKARFVKEKATKGTCPDMCPEKERQMREFQRQVASFEQSHSDDQRISHKRAIKEYSRSSADQEAPLAHELRSEKTLNMTMAYMMHNIMDLCENPDIGIGDWFHFVWDRTRSIRKEITQQELCSLNAVKLVEQCARFHIHCAGRLVGEEPSVFDTKINAENLTKCLQTLKYMYHDLRLNNIACPSESEFRSYVVLLNLRDANFLWEIKQLPVHIQKSNEIRRAILFYNALQDNNFVRFFNMIRETETSYLSACILLGYFNRLRVRAMEVLIKSYKWSKNNAFLPLPLIARTLGFEDELAAQDFVEAHGLQCDGVRVLLDRMNMPETEYKMERAINLIESKRCGSLGECICGEPLPPAELFERHVPCNSFDENGLLKPDAWHVEDELLPNNIEPSKKPDVTVQQNMFGTILQSLKMQVPIVPQQQQQQQSSQMQMQMQTATPTPTQPKLMSDNIFKIPQASPPISPKQQQQQQSKSAGGFSFVLPPPSAPAMTKIMRDEEEAKLKAAAEEARMRAEAAAKARVAEAAARAQAEAARAAAEARAAEERRRLQQRAALEKRAMELMEELVDECVKHEVALISGKVYSAELRREKSYLRMSSMIYKEIVEQLIESEVRQTHVELLFDQRLLKRCFDDWVQYTRKQQEERRLLESTPLWLTSASRQEQIDQIALPEQMTAKDFMRRYRLGSACNFSALLQRVPGSKATHAKLNLWSLLASTLPVRKLGAQRYFKLLCTLPAEDEEMLGFKNLCDRWLNRSLLLRPDQQQRSANTSKEDSISDDVGGAASDCAANGEAYINDLAHNVALCVRKVCGVSPLNESGAKAKTEELANCDGIVFFLTPKDFKHTRERLRNVVGSSRRIVFLLYDGQHCEEATLVSQLGLHKCDFEAYKIYGCHMAKSDFNFAGLFRKAVKFLARKPTNNGNADDDIDADVEQQALTAFANVQLGDEQWQRWLFSVRKNLSFREVCKKPDFVIKLFNEAASRLQEIATVDLRHAKRFPYELQRFVPQVSLDGPQRLEHFVSGWHTAAYQRRLTRFFECVKLPVMPAFNGSCTSPQDLKQFEQSIYLWLLNYSHTCLPKSVDLATQTAFAAIQALVTQMNNPDAQTLTPLERLHELNYLPILRCFAIERLYMAMRDKQHPPAIVYRLSHLRSYQQTPWWLDYAPVAEVTFGGDAFNDNQENMAAAALNRVSEEEITSQNLTELKALMGKASTLATKSQMRSGKRKADLTNHFNELTQNLDESIRRFDTDIELSSSTDNNKNECDNGTYNTNGETVELRWGGDENTLPAADDDIGQKVAHKRVKHRHDTAPDLSDKDTLKDIIDRASSALARYNALCDERQRRTIQREQSKF